MGDCVVIGAAAKHRGKQELEYFEGVSAGTAQSKGLCMHAVTIPPLGRARPHLHQNHESAVYVISGEAGMWYGEGLRLARVDARGRFRLHPRQHAAPAV